MSKKLIGNVKGPQGEKGDTPKHEWNSNQIRFQNPDGTWGNWKDLIVGPQGEKGEQGLQGLVGPKGEMGIPGPQGEWYARAAQQGLANAQYNLGCCYDNGFGVPKDSFKAVEWYTKAAQQGLTIAQYNLGGCYKYGEGVQQNIQTAEYWYQKAAAQGYQDAIDALKTL